MSEKIILGEPDGFSGPAPIQTETDYRPWEDGSGDPVVAVLSVDEDQARWAQETLGDHTVLGTDDTGATLFGVPVTSWPAFRSFLLSFLDHAELLEPAELRTDLIAWLRDIAEETT
jgi:hypothetical protein